MANEKWLIDLDKLVEHFRATKIDEVFPNWKELSPNTQAAIIRLTTKYRAIVLSEPVVDAVEVKCKVGDLVYALWEAPVKLKYIIYCAEVKEIRISVRNCRLTTTYILEPIDYRGRRREYRDEDFGTLVFKDEEDAERKLYPCEHCITGTYRSCEGCSLYERK